jgi:hypothetical protein
MSKDNHPDTEPQWFKQDKSAPPPAAPDVAVATKTLLHEICARLAKKLHTPVKSEWEAGVNHAILVISEYVPLAALPTRSEAQIRAQAFREAADKADYELRTTRLPEGLEQNDVPPHVYRAHIVGSIRKLAGDQ